MLPSPEFNFHYSFCRYQQVRQLSAENAAKVRERVRTAKQRELEEIKKRITDAIVQRNNIASPQISPVHNSQVN